MTTNNVEKRNTAVKLNALGGNGEFSHRTTSCPTADLVAVPKGLSPDTILGYVRSYFVSAPGYFIFCKNTEDVWFAPSVECLHTNFVYREDLNIIECATVHDFVMAYAHCGIPALDRHLEVRKSCYVLDNSINETYEVYYSPSVPAMLYGKTTPDGMQIHKFEDRFERDAFIMELDEHYSNCSEKRAREVAADNIDATSAIIISDGCFSNSACAASSWYLDSQNVVQLTHAFVPNSMVQAVITAEIVGVYNALMICKAYNKKSIVCYYDNQAVMTAATSKGLKDSIEVKNFEKLKEELLANGCTINFVELHPKHSDARKTDNTALMYFHNLCDKSCKQLTHIFANKYRSIAASKARVAQSARMSFKKTQQKKRGGHHDKPC